MAPVPASLDLTTTLLRAALLLNVLVLAPVCFGLARRPRWAQSVYGEPGPGRQILLAMYAAILASSLVLLVRPAPPAVLTLLVLQVVYKVLTPLTVGRIRHPVVVSNLAIAGVHAAVIGAVVALGPG